jgi:hypothetical protein
MSIEMGEDEVDKRLRGLREQRHEVIHRKRGRPPKQAQAEIVEEIIERDLEDSMLKSPTDGYRYKWVNRRYSDGERVQLHEGHGYEMVTEKNDKCRPLVGKFKEADGGFIRGDLILMRTPQANYERRRAKADEKLARATRSHIDEAMENVNQMARDARLIGPHKDSAFEQSSEGKPFMGPSANDLGK